MVMRHHVLPLVVQMVRRESDPVQQPRPHRLENLHVQQVNGETMAPEPEQVSVAEHSLQARCDNDGDNDEDDAKAG
jgi:hypothetical protein